MVRAGAEESLLRLIRDHTPATLIAPIDNLDPHRRAERSFPDAAARIDRALRLRVPEVALEMLDLAEELLAGVLPGYEPAAVAAVRKLAVSVAAAQQAL